MTRQTTEETFLQNFQANYARVKMYLGYWSRTIDRKQIRLFTLSQDADRCLTNNSRNAEAFPSEFLSNPR